ncbi:sigma-70 family RNA polymerase sigma factor [Sandarakinorhabdus sp.]|uniref:sigma-70 family RNA polymerase sigma factor n=1 Tax=Sandarakinorhabdus sp. TaxID=1916663 RepID=UPI00286E8FD3|nr:sigma-70 family RNA polymerase sigma factor [Sandarakinorhabdus sp.]
MLSGAPLAAAAPDPPLAAPDAAPATSALSDDQLMATMAAAAAPARAPSAQSTNALRTLAQRHQTAAFRLAWRMTGDHGDAEDLVQEAFARLWLQAPRWRAGDTGVRAFLQRVVTNLCIDRSRRRRPVTMAELPDRPDDAPGADALLEADERSRRIDACVRALPDRQRASIVLTYWEDMPNAAAAACMDMSVKGFESLLLRARTALRHNLAAAGLGLENAQ